MSEPVHMLDVAQALGRAVVGEKRWDAAYSCVFVNHSKAFRRDVRLLASTPVDAAEQIADAERRVEKMRHALAMVRGGAALAVLEHSRRMPILKAIEEALE